ncbi:MAG: GNAT family N-acetyltransferase [Actinobacteria bacterium]|nr:GNAT family N-acetyltransferase [Actinomycetota bacterium]
MGERFAAEPRRIEPALEGRLVRLRAREEADLAHLNEMFDDPDVLAGLMVTFPQPMAGIREWVERTRGNERDAIFVVETLEARETVGVCALEGIDARARTARFGIWIGKPHWGKGYGTDATHACCRFGFRHMNLQRIELHVYPETNPRAVRTYERVGFTLEGTLRRAQFLGSRYIDVAVMGLLAEELVE